MSLTILAISAFVDEDITIIELLVPLLLLGLIVVASLRAIREWSERLHGRFFRRNYVLVIGMSRIALQVAAQLLAQGRKVAIIAPGKLSTDAEMLRKRGAYVLSAAEAGTVILEKAGLANATTCLVATGSDKENLSTSELLRELKRKQPSRQQMRILVQVDNNYTADVMKDYLPPACLQGNTELILFNEKRLAAQLVYDLNPPYLFLNGGTRLQDEEAICVLGLNMVAELFLVENAILSQYPGERKLKVLLIAHNAESGLNAVFARRPYLQTYLDIVPVELVNSTFAPSAEWSRKLTDALPSIDSVYAFGDDDSLLFLQTMHFRQFLYTHTRQARRVPVTICMPEATSISSLIVPARKKRDDVPSVNDLNIHLFHTIGDTCTVKNLIDERELTGLLAMAVNYFYAVRYEFADVLRDEFRQANTFNVLKDIENRIVAFHPKTAAPLAELEALVIDALVAFTKNSQYRIRKHFGIRERWHGLTERQKDANRYVVRHIGNKIHYLEKSGTTDFSREALEKEMHILAPLEHKRWCAEKSAAGFVAGEFPEDDKPLKKLLKDVLKVHDQLVSFKQLDETNRKKDLDVFLILPMLLATRKRLMEVKSN